MHLRKLYQHYFCIVKTINKSNPTGKLSIVPTPIGNMNDLTPNIVRCLFQADLIGCQDQRVAGQLYSLIKNRKLISKMEEKFGPFGLSSLVVGDQKQIMDETAKEHQFYNYSNMSEREKRKFLGKMSLEEEKEFKIEYLKYRALKIVRKEDQLLFKKQKYKLDQLYGLQVSDLEHIQTQIRNTRAKKGRGVLIAINTYSQNKMFNLVKNLLESKHVAIVSDAGMPCISDPGWRLVRNVRETMPQLDIEVIGGPTAVDIMMNLAKLTSRDNTLSGRFEGFASPQISNITQESITIDKQLRLSKERDFSIHFINSRKLKKQTHRIEKIYGSNHKIVLANELTKMYERKFHGTLSELSNHVTMQNKSFDGIGQLSYLLYSDNNRKVIETEQQNDDRTVTLDANKFVKVLSETSLKSKEKAELVCSIFGIKMNESKKIVYDQIQKRKKKSR